MRQALAPHQDNFGKALLLSLALHALILSLQFGESGSGLPWFGVPGEARTASIPTLNAILHSQVAAEKPAADQVVKPLVSDSKTHAVKPLLREPPPPRLPPEPATASITKLVKLPQDTGEKGRVAARTEAKKAEQAAAARAREETLAKQAEAEALARKRQAEKAAAEKALAEKLAAEKAVAEKLAAEKASAEKAAAEKAAAEKSLAEEQSRLKSAATGKPEGGKESGAGSATGSELARRTLDQVRSGLAGLPAREPAELARPRRGSILGRDPKDIQLVFYGDGWRQKVERIGSLNYPKLS
ncbi:MAG: hypothetical protein NTY41_17735, partial [Proteobacteria bacterium]|nr:hypothetical protein [Pseudomonadota bacterium]